MTQDVTRSQLEKERLDSWKEIAAYLGRDERTAKRWEKSRGLPVHRLPGARSGVFAFSSEIDRWQIQGSVSFTAAPARERTLSDARVLNASTGAGTNAANARGAEIEAGISATGLVTPLSAPGHRFEISRVATIASLLFAGLASLFLFFHQDADKIHAAVQSPQSIAAPAHVPSREAEDLYLSGRYFWNKRTATDLDTALGIFKKAIEHDPSYAQAYIGLADTYCLMVEYAALPPKDAYPPAIAAAKQAILLDPSLAEAHRSLAFISFYWNWDHTLSEKEFRKAIEINPTDATTHHWYANALMTSRRYQDALFEIEEARKLDPTAISILADRAHILSLFPGRKQEANETLLQIEKADPSFLPVHMYLAKEYCAAKDNQDYLNELGRIAALTHRKTNEELYRAGKRGFLASGDAGLSEALAETQIKLYRRGQVSAFDVADALAGVGKKKEAIQYLKLSYRSRDTQFLTLRWRDVFPMLKDDIEFKQLAERSDQPHQEQTQFTKIDQTSITASLRAGAHVFSTE